MRSHFVFLTFASVIVPLSAYLNFQPRFSTARETLSFGHRSPRVCTYVSVVAVAKNPKQKIVSSEDENGPEGGWAPPPWKRKILHPLKDLQPGQGPIKGTVRNVESFGAFVDIGAERDGFIHVSDISTEFIHQPADFLRSGKQVDCWVKYVDEGQGKLGLTMIRRRAGEIPLEDLTVGAVMNAKILRITSFGVFLDINSEADGFMHSTKLPRRRGSPSRMALDDMTVGQTLEVRVTEVDPVRRRVAVESVDKVVEVQRNAFAAPRSRGTVFERGAHPSN